MKKAYIVDLILSTSVIVDDKLNNDELEETLYKKAKEKVTSDLEGYLTMENMDFSEDDLELVED